MWLTSGNYLLGHLDTKIKGSPEHPITFRPLPGAQARIDGSLSFYSSPGYVILRDLELYSSNPDRVSAETNVGFSPTDITIIPGIASYAPNMSFVNLIVHDETRHGFYVSQSASNNVIYGSLVYNNGWMSPDNAEGHGIYVQGANGGREVAENIVFNNSGADLHVYENAPNLRLAGVTLVGNVAFNAGAIQNVRPYRDWIVGVDAPAINADRIVLRNNMGYVTQYGSYSQVQVGRDGVNGSVALLNNYLPQGLAMNNWTIAAVAGNFLMGQHTNDAVSLNQTQVLLAAAWNGNRYTLSVDATGFSGNSIGFGFTGWQGATGFDSNSTYRVGYPSGTEIFVRPNAYEPGRANIIVYNWDHLTNVAVDVSSVLTSGATYEVRNAEDFFGPPVLSGVFDGTPLHLPMTGLTVAAPNGSLITPPPTGPTFNVFVLLPYLIRLEARAINGQVRLSWPTNVGRWVLQTRGALSRAGAWADLTIVPAVIENSYIVEVPLTAGAGFYRLRAAR